MSCSLISPEKEAPPPPFGVPYNTLPGVPLPGLPPVPVPAVPGRYGTNLSSPLATPPSPAPSISCVNVVIPLPLFPLPRPISGVNAIGSAKTSILTELGSRRTCLGGVLGGLVGLVYAGGGAPPVRERREPGGVRFLPRGAGTMSRREKSLRMTGGEPAGMMGWEMMLPKEEVEEGVRLREVEVVGAGGGRLLRRMRRNATKMAARTATSAPMVMPAIMAAEGVLFVLEGEGVGSGEAAAPLVVGRVGVGGGGGVVVVVGGGEEVGGGGGGGMDWSLSRTQRSSPAQE